MNYVFNWNNTDIITKLPLKTHLSIIISNNFKVINCFTVNSKDYVLIAKPLKRGK